MPVEALLLPLRMPLFCSFEIIALVGCGIILSLLRKGIIDIPLMILFNSIWGVDGIAVAIPVSDFIALVVAVILVLPYLKEISGTALPLDETAVNLPHRN